MIIVIAFFGLALPVYHCLRKRSPESGWNLGGNVASSHLSGFDLLGTGAVVLFIATTWKLKGSQLGGPLPELSSVQILSSAVIYLLIAAIIPTILFWRISLNEALGLKWQNKRSLVWIVPIFLLGMMLSGMAVESLGWSEWVATKEGGRQLSVETLTKTRDLKLITALVFAAVIAAPVAEEIIFRGYIYPVAKRFTEHNFAAFFSAALFSIAHFNLNALPLLFLFGIAMAWVYEHTGSIWAPIFCHMAFNGLQLTYLLGMRFSGGGTFSWLFS